MGPGDSLTLFDGRGGEYTALISSVSKKAVTVEVAGHIVLDMEYASSEILAFLARLKSSQGERPFQEASP